MKINQFLLRALVLSSLLLSFFFNISGVQAAGVGNSPAVLKNDHVLPGMNFEEVIYISRTDTEEASKLNVTTSGDEKLLEWMTFPDEANLVIKKGENVLPIKIMFTVPEKAAIREYKGSIFVHFSSADNKTTLKSGEVGIALGLHIPVELSVIGNQITDYQVMSVTVGPQKEEGPLFVDMTIRNIGNTEVSALEGKINIYSVNTTLLQSFDFAPFNESISPNETKTVKMVFSDFKAEKSQYWIAVRALKGGTAIYEDRFLLNTTTFEEPPIALNTLTIPAPEAEVKSAAPIGSNSYLIWGLVVILMLVAVVGIVLKNRKRDILKQNTNLNNPQ